MIERSLTDKVILITGGAQRLGAQTAKFLHASGANLVIHYRHSSMAAEKLRDELESERSHSISLIQADLLNADCYETIIQAIYEQWGRLDALVNNASSFYPTPVGSVRMSDWDDLMGSNLKAPFFLSQAAAKLLSINQGCIVNIVDIHAQQPMSGHSVYNMAKAGLAMQVKTLARELGPDIRVNGIAPGAILWPEKSPNMSNNDQQKIIASTFLKRQGIPADIARTVLFLIRDADYITGQIIAVDGGRSLSI